MSVQDPLVNIVITTTYERGHFFNDCIGSIIENTVIPHRIITVCDGAPNHEHDSRLSTQIMLIQPNQGIACALNAGWALAEMYNKFHNQTPYFCYIQDDTIVTRKGWLELLIQKYIEFDKCGNLEGNKIIPILHENISFFSGHDAPEHKTIAEYIAAPNRTQVKIKESMRATNMIAETSLWRNLMPLGRHNPDGSIRGFPDAPKNGQKRGKGSNIDVFLTGCNSAGYQEKDAHPQNPYKLGFKCLIIPGLVKHVATEAKDSTWGNKNVEH